MGIRTAIRGSVHRLAGRGFRVDITNRGPCYFADVAQFETFLAESRRPDARALRRFSRMDAERLQRELLRTEKLHRALLDLLILVGEGQRSRETLWRDLDIGVVPDESHWPSILFACSFEDDLPPAWREAAVAAFLEFLRARKQCLHEELARRGAERGRSRAETDEVSMNEIELDAVNAWLQKDIHKIASITRAAMTRDRDYRRLPYDIPVSIVLEEGKPVPLFLARWKVTLEANGRSLVLRQDDQLHPLHPGKNTVGRSADCDIFLSKAPLDVSRAHLVLDWRGRSELVARDISMKGSWIPRALLDHSR